MMLREVEGEKDSNIHGEREGGGTTHEEKEWRGRVERSTMESPSSGHCYDSIKYEFE